MKTLKYLALFMLVFSCKTKSVTVEKAMEKERESLSGYFDSLFRQTVKIQLDWQKKQSNLTDNLKLSSITELDSSGNRKPFHYRYYVDGQLKEEIYLEGGEINKETQSNKSDEFEHKQEYKKEKTRVEVDVGRKKEATKSKYNKSKKDKVLGYQFGFYVWLFLIIIVLVVLYWISKKLKLPDRFTGLFGSSGG